MSDPALAAVPSHELFSPEVAADPHPLLHRLRAESPLTWVPPLDGHLLTRHADIVAALKDRRLTTANLGQGLDRLSQAERDELAPLLKSIRLWMGHTDDDDHVRFQQLLKRYFTPATVDTLRPRVRQLTHELLDAVAGRGRMDVVKDLAYPLPANVIAEMLGMPTSEREQLQAWSRDITAVFAPADFERLVRSRDSVLEMQDYLRGLVAQRRAEPREDLLSMFVAAEREGVVDEDEIVANCVLLLFAGHETTANLIANGLVLLFDNPEQLALLKSRRELMPTAVEEMLRLDGPAGVVVRVTAEPAEVAGRQLPVGQVVYLAMLAGNRDPEVFADPDAFDITRKPNRHTAFGLGAFYCLGAALARMETDECFNVLLDRLPDIRPAYDAPDRVSTSPLNRRLATLEVAFRPTTGDDHPAR
ncbi:cytochrome P450 [Saccharothrix tamanrassetensis]|uniref:Cytochrome P450 n=1 Tax=Saccharothrix tamanrassetensis TaxID=1051531 RepID=A0A841CK82_9PSEU|nr:cytochrome P450 [Saccharothrix tamanrassetensis]MBB5957921.1 cytochrome P450 [Saccharothrix tamanrassetensis]